MPEIQTALDNFMTTYISDSPVARGLAIEASKFVLAPVKAVDDVVYIAFTTVKPIYDDIHDAWYAPASYNVSEPELLGADKSEL
jgi:hypothetical protein